ncbi:MAG: VOC family protein [Thermoleophilia bacterium]
MPALDHVTIRATDPGTSMRLYRAVLGALSPGAGARQIQVARATAGEPATRGAHIAFAAGSRGQVEEFWRAGLDAGFADDGPPGVRPRYRPDYFGAFLRDPDGNSVEAVHHGDAGTRRTGGVIDHVWAGVDDLGATRRFYDAIAPHAGLTARTFPSLPGLVQFRAADGTSCSFVADGRPATRNLHLAFPAPDEDAVAAFHAAALRAGGRPDGLRGVLDPDGTRVEAVLTRGVDP